MLVVETQGLTKTYRRGLTRTSQPALLGMDLAVPAGSAFGLIGPNGAGKTTFIKILLGIVRPTHGSVRLLGSSPDDPRARAKVGYLPERLDLPPAWTPLQFLRSVGRLKGLSSVDSEARHQLERVAMSNEGQRQMGTFSKGMRQRIGLASALLGAPELLVLDEPTDGLDPLARIAVRDILAAELTRGASLYLNSHLLSETERICGRIGILSSGKLVREGRLDALTASQERWRLRFAPGADLARLKAAGFVAPTEAEPDIWHWEGTDAVALNSALGHAHAAGAILIELSHGHRTLEDVLKEAVKA